LQANSGLVIGAVAFDGFTTSKANQASGRPAFWRAEASFTQPVTTTETTTAVLHREVPTAPVVPVTNPDPEPDQPAFPDWFHRVGLKLQLDRGDVVLAEINGEIDIRTAAERSLASNDPTATLPPAPNPNDGISQFLVRLDLDKVKAEWQISAAFKAIDADTDGLWKITRPPEPVPSTPSVPSPHSARSSPPSLPTARAQGSTYRLRSLPAQRPASPSRT
jgi:hypothetical protein